MWFLLVVPNRLWVTSPCVPPAVAQLIKALVKSHLYHRQKGKCLEVLCKPCRILALVDRIVGISPRSAGSSVPTTLARGCWFVSFKVEQIDEGGALQRHTSFPSWHCLLMCRVWSMSDPPCVLGRINDCHFFLRWLCQALRSLVLYYYYLCGPSKASHDMILAD